MIPELKSLTYEARLKRLNLTTLEIRIIRGDLIEVYRILNGLEKINPDSLFTRSRYTNIRCHTMKLEKKQVHLDIRKYFFTQRVIDYWNALPQSADDAENINQFKDQLNIHSNVHGKELSRIILVPENHHFLCHLQTKEATNNASHSANIQQKSIMFVSNNREIMWLVY